MVTGCYAQRAPQEIAALPGVTWVVGNSHKHQVAEIAAAHNWQPETPPQNFVTIGIGGSFRSGIHSGRRHLCPHRADRRPGLCR